MAQRLKEALDGKSKDKGIQEVVKKLSKYAIKSKWGEGYIDSLMVMTIDKTCSPINQTNSNSE